MGGKHLKRKRAERSKVHLKKKTLAKGQNVTNTTFIVRKIVTAEQLKKVGNEPVSSWNIPLKDLLLRLNHYNFTSRLNSLNGIKELVTNFPEILKGPNLKSTIEKLLQLITDPEKKIRVTTVDLLSYIFDVIPPGSRIPFHDILTAYLGCAMTHRTVAIQHDSIKYINFIIKYSPDALRINFKSTTINFIRILKNYLNEFHSETGSQKDLEKAKTEMLFSFHQFLITGYSNTEKKEFSEPNSCYIDFLVKQNISLRGTSEQYKQIPNLSLFCRTLENKKKTLTVSDSDEFQSLCPLVTALVFDTWAEFSPNQVASECVVSESTGELLSVLLKILLFLYDKAVALKDVQMEYWFASKYGPGFERAFSSKFPYLPIQTKWSEENFYSESSEKSCNVLLTQNLIICLLSYSFKIVNKNSLVETKMENFIISALLMKNPTEVDILLKVVEKAINSETIETKTFLSNVVAAYNTTNNSELRRGLSKALMRMVLKDNTAYLKDPSVIQWMKSLPDCLYKSQIFVQEVQDILKLINKPIGSEILKEIECKGEEIMKNLPHIRIKGVSVLEGQKLIVNILYRCNDKVLEEFIKKKIFNSSSYTAELKNYIVNIFSQKLKHSP